MKQPTDWSKIESGLALLLELPRSERPAALTKLSGEDTDLRNELEELLKYAEADDARLDRPALGPLGNNYASVKGLAPGDLVGTYRVIELIGRGGMGHVYRAERADGTFEQQAALKLIRPEAIDHLERFQFERRILARLEHDNITRIYDGGVLPDGQPYMVMELVAGEAITSWCRKQEADLDTRLDLFLTVCDAVSYAHRSLIVHRDLKPSNVLVTPGGKVKVLDFGIAKQMADTGGPVTLPAPMTPGYAAPEQLTGDDISTATDSYALGMMLFELLAGAPPWVVDDMPLAATVNLVLNQPAPSPSGFTERSSSPPISPKLLKGDLDAIVAKAVRKEPLHRYKTVDALALDIQHYRRGEPVGARGGSRLYVAGRFIRRHRLPIAAASLISVAVLGGLAGVTWQYLRAQQQYVRAEREATRATTIKSFLIGLFNDTDPGFPTDKPRSQATATELMDLAVNRIDREYASDLRLRIELLDTVSQIYLGMDVNDRGVAIAKRQITEATKLYGATSPEVVGDQIALIWVYINTQDAAEAGRQLNETDRLLRESGQDESKLRAQWWDAKGEWLKQAPDSAQARTRAFDEAIRLYARYDPTNAIYFSALANAGTVHLTAGDYAGAKSLYQQAIHIAPTLKELNYEEVSAAYSNMGVVLESLGEFKPAEQNYDLAAKIARDEDGIEQPGYWFPVFRHAQLVHKLGERGRALSMFDDLLAAIPKDWSTDTSDTRIKVGYASCLAAEGRAEMALPLLEAALKIDKERPFQSSDMRSVLAILGDTYDRAGRTDEARAALSASLAEYLAKDPDGPRTIDIQERWGRFLLDHHGDPREAAKYFDAVIAVQQQWGPYLAAPALAWGGRARLALSAGDIPAAIAASDASLAAFDKIKGLNDVRSRADLLRIRSGILLAAGDKTGAAKAATDALAESQRTDVPDSPAIVQARTALAAATADLPAK